MDNHDKTIKDIVVGVKGMKINMLSKINADNVQLKRMLDDIKEMITLSRSVGEVSRRVHQYDEESAMVLIRQAKTLLDTVSLMQVNYNKLSEEVKIHLDDLEGK